MRDLSGGSDLFIPVKTYRVEVKSPDTNWRSWEFPLTLRSASEKIRKTKKLNPDFEFRMTQETNMEKLIEGGVRTKTTHYEIQIKSENGKDFGVFYRVSGIESGAADLKLFRTENYQKSEFRLVKVETETLTTVIE